MGDSASMGAFLTAVASLGIIFFLIFVVLYVLKSIGLATMADNRGIEYPWLAWVPVGDLYIMGALVGEMNLFGIQVNDLSLWYPVTILVGTLLSSIPFLGIIFAIGLIIFQVAFIYFLFKQYTKQATLLTVLSIFFGFLFPIFLFTLRNEAIITPESTGQDITDNVVPASVPEEIQPEEIQNSEENNAEAKQSEVESKAAEENTDSELN